MRGNHDQWGEKNHSWKGDQAKYSTIHDWVRKYKPKPPACQRCYKMKDWLELSNISGKYLRDIDDYEYLCALCHRLKDGPGFTGHTHSNTTKKKMRTKKLGKKQSAEHRKNKSEAIKIWWKKRKESMYKGESV